MPSPESPAKRMTARSRTSRLCFTGGTSASVDILVPTLHCSLNSPYPGECGSIKDEAVGERMASEAARQEPTRRGYHTGLRMDAGDKISRRCVLLEKTQGVARGFQRESTPGCRAC